MCEVRGVILGLGFVRITLISHFPHPTSHFPYKLQFSEKEKSMEYKIGDIVEFKKQHPCGSKTWEITRVGVDFKFKCMRL